MGLVQLISAGVATARVLTTPLQVPVTVKVAGSSRNAFGDSALETIYSGYGIPSVEKTFAPGNSGALETPQTSVLILTGIDVPNGATVEVGGRIYQVSATRGIGYNPATGKPFSTQLILG